MKLLKMSLKKKLKQNYQIDICSLLNALQLNIEARMDDNWDILIYTSQRLWIGDSESYYADVYIDFDYNHSTELDEFLEEIVDFIEKANRIQNSDK